MSVARRPNPLAQAIAERRFCYVVELVASALKRESQVLEVASRLARIPQLVAGSITSYAGGAMGHDPMRVATAARARGLTPNVHVTCVSQDRRGLGKTLEDLSALGLVNVFALTGDWPKVGTPVFDLDSVQLVRMIAELRHAGIPFHVSVAVSPFKYIEADQMYQYLKLEKKVAAGADLAITQVGWDARKLAELKRYVDDRGLGVPLLGNVYVVGPRAAEKMAKGEPPGCWVSPELLEIVRTESRATDGGLKARLERAARTVAVLRGLGYAGAYIGGTHDPDHVQWIIRRAEALVPRWRQHYEELAFGRAGGFYLYERGEAPNQPRGSRGASAGPDTTRREVGGAAVSAMRDAAGAAGMPSTGGETDRLRGPRASSGPVAGVSPRGRGSRVVPRMLDVIGRLFPVTRDTALRRALRGLFTWIDRRPALARLVERVELAVKRPAFGCEACGNCVLGWMEYVCPQTCPKQMRNGPCGGTHMGRCEVVDRPCIWVGVWDRAKAASRTEALLTHIPPPDRSLRGTSSWINYFLERDRRPGRTAA